MFRLFIAFLLAGLAGPVAALLAAAPSEGGVLLVFTMPGQDGAGIIRASGGYPVGVADAPFAILAASDRPGFADRLAEHGAVWVRGGEILATICGVSET